MILVVGEALVDLVIEVDGTVTAALGGAPFNTARALGRLGSDVAFAGSVSVDRFGSLLAAQLADDGVSIESMPRCDLPTTLAAAELDERGAATYRFYIARTAAPALSELPEVECDVVFTGGLGLVLEPMAEVVARLVEARTGDALVMVDVNCRPLIVPDRTSYLARVRQVVTSSTIVKVSDEDLAYLSPDAAPLDAARELLHHGPSAVLVTAGGDATHILTAEGEASVPVEPVEVLDTIGAGDSFGAGFLAWWTASGLGIDDAGRLDLLVAATEAANAVAAIVVGRRGADPPWRNELSADWSP